MTKPTAALILAAGLSRRMGKPKMLLPWGQTTVLGQVISTFARAGVQKIVVITGGSRQPVEALVQDWQPVTQIECVYNPGFESGEMLSSIQCGLGALGSQFAAALIGLGDQPQLSLAAVQSVLDHFESDGGSLIVPSFNFRRGHPWLIGREYWGELLSLQSPATPREFLNTHSGEIIYVEADFTVLKDLDTPDEYQREKP